MDVRSQPRDRVFSILNNNDCPSFVIRQRNSPEPQYSPTRSHKQERPNLLRQAQYRRTSSFSSSASSSSPSLFRNNSSSSKSSHSSMEPSLSPITPAYQYNDTPLLPYDGLLSQNMVGFIPTPTTLTPFMEQQMMLAPIIEPQVKGLPQVLPNQYPLLPAPAPPVEVAQLPTPTSLNSAVAASSIPNSASPPNGGPPTGKKNKYPCPYAQSHNCGASFTTSGHAARHGKKHTGEKGVHCPVCNKAFTRKDNMKQHERTHKTQGPEGSEETNPRKSKAAITREAQKGKQLKKSESTDSEPLTQPSTLQSPLSEVTSIAPSLEAPIPLSEPPFYTTEPISQLVPLMPIQSLAENLSPNSLYPLIADENMMIPINAIPPPLPEKLPDLSMMVPITMAPPLIRGFSDLDTLAQAAETFDPYYQQTM